MIEDLSHKIKKLFSKKKEHSWKMKPITSSFNNIAHYSLDSFENARIQVKNVIPYRFKNTINFKKEDIFIVVTTNKTIEKTLQFEKEEIETYGKEVLIDKAISILQNEIVKELDRECLHLMSDMGRITSGSYGQIKQTIGNFTISDSTKADAIIDRLSFCDRVFKEFTNTGLKHITISKFLHKKLQEFIEGEYIKVNHKKIKYEILPEHINNEPLCIIGSSQIIDELTPGIVMVYSNMKVTLQESNKTLSVTLSEDYALEKVGLKSELYYIRFLQTY